MLILLGLGVIAVAAGWRIGRPRALSATIVAVISRIEREREGQTPETWAAATLLFTAVFALLVVVGVVLRRVFGPQRVSRREQP